MLSIEFLFMVLFSYSNISNIIKSWSSFLLNMNSLKRSGACFFLAPQICNPAERGIGKKCKTLQYRYIGITRLEEISLCLHASTHFIVKVMTRVHEKSGERSVLTLSSFYIPGLQKRIYKFFDYRIILKLRLLKEWLLALSLASNNSLYK